MASTKEKTARYWENVSQEGEAPVFGLFEYYYNDRGENIEVEGGLPKKFQLATANGIKPWGLTDEQVEALLENGQVQAA